MVETERLADVFVEIADTLVDEFDVIEFLHLVTNRTAELTDADAAGLMLADHRGRLRFMAASTEGVRMLELLQVQNHEGPCLDCFLTGQPVINADLLEAGDRWPRFAKQATDAGYRSVHGIPLRLRSEVIGALNVFSTGPGTLVPRDVHMVQALADIATIGLLQERAIRRSETLAEQLQGALNSRVIVEQAKGAIAQQLGISVDAAFEVMRSYARRHQQRLSDVAQRVVTQPALLASLTVGSD